MIRFQLLTESIAGFICFVKEKLLDLLFLFLYSSLTANWISFLGKQKNLNKSVFVTIFHFTDQNNYLINQEDNQQMNSIIVSSPICRCRKYESYKESIFYNPMLHKYQHVLMCWVTCFCSSTVCRLLMHLGLLKSRFFKSSIKVWNAVMLCVNRSDIRL